MIRNYLLISFRNLRKHFSYSSINIVGLGLGLATCLLLVIWIKHELSYDKFHLKTDRIYRVSLEYGFGGKVSRTAVSGTALLPALTSLPETETGVRVYNCASRTPYIVRSGEKVFHERHFYAADSSFFDVFSFNLVKGNPKEALTKPYTLIVTETTSKKYFGNEDPIGKVLRINDSRDYLVTGVMEDVPANSHMKFDFLCSFTSLAAGREEPIWWSANYQTFIVTNAKADINALQEKIDAIAMKAVAGEISGEGDYVHYNFIPLTELYLKSDFDSEPEVLSDVRYVYIFSAVALLILLIACINYVNLATARATERAKEVGIRKVVGALRKQLFFQFIGESLIITFFSFCVAYLLAQGLLPLFNILTGKNFSYHFLLEPSIIGSSIVVLILIAFLAGSYPALAITSFKPVSVLKGNFKTSGRGVWLRKSLVVFQFGISIILIAGTIIIIKQLDFIQQKNLGYDRENTIALPLDNQTAHVFEAFKTEITRTGAAIEVGRGSESPVNIQAGYSVNTEDDNRPGIVTNGLRVDEGYLPAMGMELKEGRNFTKHDFERLIQDTAYTFILNEAALKALSVEPGEAIGKSVFLGPRKGEIIGVVKDFHFASLHKNISPLVIFPDERQLNTIFIRIPAGDIKHSIEKIQTAYTTLLPHRPFEYEFLDQQFESLYKNEQRLSSVFIVFASLAIIIACLGLLGLVSFSAAQKTKEIGIRKVLGATAGNIIILITKDFTRLVAIAVVIGSPLAYWLMTEWLKGFAYKTEIGLIPVFVAAAACFVISLITAGYQAIKAALLDPVKTLRSE